MSNLGWIGCMCGLVVLQIGFSGCSEISVSPDANSPEKATPISLETRKQNTRRVDCKGIVKSEQLEVIRSPSMRIEIAPKDRRSIDNIERSSFVDVQTSSSSKVNLGHIDVTISLEEGLQYMRVVSGVNEIRYRIQFDDRTQEEGSRFINVAASETVVDGWRTINECK